MVKKRQMKYGINVLNVMNLDCICLKRNGDMFPKTMELKFIDTLTFRCTSLEKAIVNHCFWFKI